MSDANADAARAAVLECLDELRADSKRAALVYEYVAGEREPEVSTTALLWTLRRAPELALELRSSMGRHVIAAVEGVDGEVRYPRWTHNVVAARSGHGDVRIRSVDRRHTAAELLEDRRPIVRLRSETPLAGLETGTQTILADGGVTVPNARPEAQSRREVVIDALTRRVERGNGYVKAGQIADRTALSTQQVASNLHVLNEAGILEPWGDASNSPSGGRVYRIDTDRLAKLQEGDRDD